MSKKRAATKSKRRAHAKARRHPSRRAAKAPAPAKLKLGPIRRQLLEMRDDLMRTVRKQQLSESALQDTGDSVDQASQAIERELLFELSDNERMTLDQIEAALRKMEKGNYGLCESCRKPISKARILALPFARYCIACQSTAESSAPEMLETVGELRGFGEEAGREVG